MFDGQVEVGNSLGLNALGSIYEQQRALAGGNASAYFVAEIYVARCVDQIEDIGFAVRMLVIHLNGVALDGDAPLAFEVHIVQGLLLDVPVADRTRKFQ